jgi:hypothetical protein
VGAKMQLTGVEMLLASLQHLRPELMQGAEPILKKHAEQAAAMIRAVYPLGETGELKAGVQVLEKPPAGARVTDRLVSLAPYASYYEFGTARQRPRPTFFPISSRAQAAAVKEIVSLVTTQGLDVKGAPNG